VASWPLLISWAAPSSTYTGRSTQRVSRSASATSRASEITSISPMPASRRPAVARSRAVEDTVSATPITSLSRMTGTTTTIARGDHGHTIGGSAL
jgi:hypothetical protein